MVWLSGLRAGLWMKGLLVQFPVRTHDWVVGQVPSRGCARSNHTLMFLSLFFSLPSPQSKNKWIKSFKKYITFSWVNFVIYISQKNLHQWAFLILYEELGVGISCFLIFHMLLEFIIIYSFICFVLSLSVNKQRFVYITAFSQGPLLGRIYHILRFTVFEFIDFYFVLERFLFLEFLKIFNFHSSWY